MKFLIGFATASLLAQGCALVPAGTAAGAAAAAHSLIPAGAAATTAHAAASASANAGTVAGIGAGATVVTTYADGESMVGKSEANIDVCAGVTGRTKGPLEGSEQKWTYERGACKVVFTFDNGFVNDVSFSGPSFMCRSLIGRCL